MTAPAAGWSDEVDEILAGDLTAGLAYATPAGGAAFGALQRSRPARDARAARARRAQPAFSPPPL